LNNTILLLSTTTRQLNKPAQQLCRVPYEIPTHLTTTSLWFVIGSAKAKDGVTQLEPQELKSAVPHPVPTQILHVISYKRPPTDFSPPHPGHSALARRAGLVEVTGSTRRLIHNGWGLQRDKNVNICAKRKSN